MKAENLPIEFMSVVGVAMASIPESSPRELQVSLLLRTATEHVIGPMEVTIIVEDGSALSGALQAFLEEVESCAAGSLGILRSNIDDGVDFVPPGIGTNEILEL